MCSSSALVNSGLVAPERFSDDRLSALVAPPTHEGGTMWQKDTRLRVGCRHQVLTNKTIFFVCLLYKKVFDSPGEQINDLFSGKISPSFRSFQQDCTLQGPSISPRENRNYTLGGFKHLIDLILGFTKLTKYN